MRQRPPKTLRLSPEFEQLISGVSENENAVMRALLLIGADTVGLDVQTVQADIRRTLSAELPPSVYNQLLALYQRVQRAAPHATDAGEAPSGADPPRDPSSNDPDPFASVGFDFD